MENQNDPRKKKITVKKVGTGSLNGDYTPDLTDREMTVKNNIRKNSQSKTGNKAIEEIHGIKKGEDETYSKKEYENKYIPGNRSKGEAPKVVNKNTGKVVATPKNRDDVAFRKQFVSDSTRATQARVNNADFYNNRIHGTDNAAKKRRDAQATASENQKFEEADKKVIKEANLTTQANRKKARPQ
jgi:hypothetical protein